MTESYSSADIIRQYYISDDGRDGAHLPFNFVLINEISKSSKAENFVTTISDWFKNIPDGKVTNWVVSQVLISDNRHETKQTILNSPTDWQSRPTSSG